MLPPNSSRIAIYILCLLMFGSFFIFFFFMKLGDNVKKCNSSNRKLKVLGCSLPSEMITAVLTLYSRCKSNLISGNKQKQF